MLCLFGQFFLELWSAKVKVLKGDQATAGDLLSEADLGLKGTAFDKYIASLTLLVGELTDTIIERALDDFVRAMKPYSKVRSWSFKKSLRELDKLDVSSELCDALACIRVSDHAPLPRTHHP